MNFDILKNIVAIELVKEVKPRGIVATPKNPTGMKLRIFKDGAIYPSQELTDTFDLEYWNKGVSEDFNEAGYKSTNGFDVYSSTEWCQFPKEVTEKFIFISAVPKSEPKVTLFGSVDYNEDGTPKKSVLTQGSKRPELVEMLREVFNKGINNFYEDDKNVTVASHDTLFGSKNYVDLVVNTEVKVFEGLNEYYIPKKFVKGSKAGQMSYETRTGITVHPLTLDSPATFGEIEDFTEEVVENQVEEVETIN